MNLEERKQRVIARGEHSNHSHVLVGDVTMNEEKGTFMVGPEGASLKHILESEWLRDGSEVWTKEHHDIVLEPGKTYEYVAQIEKDPYEDEIRRIND